MISQQIIPLKSILQNNRIAIDAFGNDLEKRGYAFIRLSPELVNLIDPCVSTIEKFFLQQLEYKKKFVKEPVFGYFGVDHKESFRILTGSRLNEHKFPEGFDNITNLVKIIDRIMHSIILLTSPVLFPNVLAESEKLDVPLLKRNKPWAMFDFSKYYNDGTRTKLNCEEHYDPGLLSFSLRSTEPGLQLKNENGRWVIPPIDKTVAIIWAGNAATIINPKIKHGIHRVVNPIKSGVPRISMWHEVCISAQEHTELLQKQKLGLSKMQSEISSPKIMPNSFVFRGKTEFPTSKLITPKKNPFDYETDTGISYTKSYIPPIKKNPFDTKSVVSKVPTDYENETGISYTKSSKPFLVDLPKGKFIPSTRPINPIKYENRIGVPTKVLKESPYPTNMSGSLMFQSYNPIRK